MLALILAEGYTNTIMVIQNLQVPVPWKLVYTEEYDSLEAAKKRELQIKKMKSRKYIETLIAKDII